MIESKRKYNIKPLFRVIKLISSLIIFILTLVLSYEKEYASISILPLSYILLDSIFSNKLKIKNWYSGGLIYNVALIGIFVRYVITPFVISITGDFYTSYGNYVNMVSVHSINLAVMLMILELVCIYFIFFISKIKYSKKYDFSIVSRIKSLDHKLIVVVFMLVVTPVLLLIEPRLIIPSNLFLVGENFQRAQIELENAGIFFILSRMVKPIYLIVFISFMAKKYHITHKRKFIIFSFIGVITYVGLQTSTTRWEIVFAGIIGLYLIKETFNRIPRSIILVLVFVISISFFSASMYKFSWAINNSETPIKDISIEMMNMVQNYFSGPALVANSIEMKESYSNVIDAETFFNDFAGSVPGVSKYIDQSNRINAYYNRYTGRPEGHNTQIIPMIGIGYIYFPVFPPIFTMICYWFVFKFDYRLKTISRIEYKYLYLYSGLYLAMAIGFNTQIIFTTFLQRFLPLFLLFKLNSTICLNKSNNEKSYYETRLDLTKPH